jgi:hypothetical protein
MLHLAKKRYVYRCEDETEVLVYSNQPEVSLYVNGKLHETLKGEHVFKFTVKLEKKTTKLVAKAGNLNNFKNKIKELSLKENKSSLSLFIKFLYCFIKTGRGYSDFLNYKLYKRNSKELNEYVTIKHQDWFYEIVSPSAYKKFFTIKPDFLRNFSKYIGRDFFADGSVEELEIFLKNNPEFMIKPYDGLGGQGVAKMTREQAGTAE